MSATEAAPPRIVITGGTSGIGLACAHRFLAAGARVVVNGRDPARGEAALAALRARHQGAEVTFVAADVSTPDGVAALVEGARASLGGGCEVLVNSAGGDFIPTLFHDMTPETIDGVLRHWLHATILCCREMLPHLADGGAIVSVASDAGKVPTPGESVIGAAMAGIAMFSRTLAMEAKRRRVRVNVVTPSLVEGTLTSARVTGGGFSARLFEKAARLAHLGLPEADDVAALVVFLASPEAAKLTGQVISVNGGISAG